MWCPYCGYEMREGHVRLRGQWAALAGVLAVNFETVDGSGEGSEMLPRTLFRSHPRAAHCCVRCEAVLVEPKSGEYVPPPAADSDAGAGAKVETEAETGDDVGSESADGEANGNGNGTGNGRARGADRGG